MQSVTATFSGAMNSNYRTLADGVLVSWDKTTASGITYFTIGSSKIGGSDILKSTAGGTIAFANQYNYSRIPSSGVVSWTTNISLDQYPYGLVQRQADVVLSNASKNYLSASGTALGPNIHTGRPVIIQAGFGNETIPMFTGYSDAPVNDIASRTTTLHCYDAIDYLNSFTSQNTKPLLNQRKDQIIDSLLKEAGFATNQYSLEISLDPPLAYFDPYGQMIGDIIRDFCESEGAIFFAQENGLMTFWNRQHFAKNATPVATLSYSNMQSLQQQDSPIINYVTVSSSPTALVSGTQQLYTLNQPYYIQANGPSSTNKIANPSFEVSTSGWSGTLSRISTQSYKGSYSASGTSMTYDLSSATSPSADGVGLTATAGMWLKAASGRSVSVVINGSAVTGQSITGNPSTTVTTNGSWQSVTVSGNHYTLASTGALGAFATTNGMYEQRYMGGCVALNGYVYWMAGQDGTYYYRDTPYAQLAGGTSVWNSTTSLPIYMYGQGAAVCGSYIYNAGGYQFINSTTVVGSNVYVTSQGANGSLFSWKQTTSLPKGICLGGLTSANGYLVFTGGWDGNTFSAATWTAQVGAGGAIGAWIAQASLGTARQALATASYNGYVYAIGGYGGSAVATVEYAQVTSSGTISSWTATTALPVAARAMEAVAVNGYLYVSGGFDSNNNSSSAVYKAAINANGTLGTWSAVSSFTRGRGYHGMVTDGSSLYIVAGVDGIQASGNTTLSDVQDAAINTSGVTLTVSGSQSFLLDAAYTDLSLPYFDGDTADTTLSTYSWTSTSGLSASQVVSKPAYLNVQAQLGYEAYSLVEPVASGLNNPNIGARQSFYSFSSVSGTGGIYGNDMTSSVTLTNYSVSGTTAYLTFQNNSTNQAYLTNLQLFGQVAQAPSNPIVQSYLDQNSINKYRLNPSNNGVVMAINNNYIPNTNSALGLAEYLVQGYSTPYLKHTTDIFTRPNLQFGDCVALYNRDTGETRNGFVVGIQVTRDVGGVFTQKLTIQEKNIASYFTIGTSTIGSPAQIAP